MLGQLVAFRKRLLEWYSKNRRDLPWRVPLSSRSSLLPPPYHVFVSEAMLQQTQVSTVIPYFHRFIERFPDFHALAAAPEQEVLRLWQGLGYYSRARNLQKAARAIVERFGGELPWEADDLLELPGVGRYTAGAIASLAYDRPAPILDGNVIRVLVRLDGIRADPREMGVRDLLWQRAETILPSKRVGDFNSALMELGATVCTPRNPLCLFCPVRRHCAAFAAGIQEKIPPARKQKPRPIERRWTLCIHRNGQWLIEQRPAKGRWAGMWQFVTIVAGEGKPTPRVAELAAGVRTGPLRKVGEVSHGLTHRQYELTAFAADVRGSANGIILTPNQRPRQWVTLEELSNYPLSRPQLRIAALLSGG